MKVALISPKGPLYRHRGGIFKKNLRYAPLTLTTLASLIPDDLDVDLTIIDEGIEDVPMDLEADLIGMTVITGSATRSYELSRHFRSRGITVLLGGPHITLVPDDAAPHADAIVVGYAEDSWPQLLKDYKSGELKSRYDQSPDLSLANRPLPRRDLLPRGKYLTKNVFEATRGCVHRCDFCVVPAAWGRKPLQRPVEDIVEDIRQTRARKAIFIDLNIIADRSYAMELFAALIPLKISWYGLATTTLVNDSKLLDLASRSGCRGLLMGLESILETNLKSTKKSFNAPAQYLELVKTLHQHQIALQGCFVFGLDHDTPDVFTKTAQFAIDAKIDLPRYAILTPFPGTALYHRLDSEDRILTKNWELYDGQHAVFQPLHMTTSELYQGTRSAWLQTYRPYAIAKRLTGLPSGLLVNLIANIGYRHYAHHLEDTYNCDWIIGQDDSWLPGLKTAA